MEGLSQKLDRTQNDLSQIIELYDFAEKLLPYENIRGPFQVSSSQKRIIIFNQLNENDQRRNVAHLASYGDGQAYLNGCGFWGFMTLILMNRANSGKWTDTAPLTRSPMRAFSWFMMGVSIAALVNVARFREAGYDRATYNLNQRVAQNEHTHAIARNIQAHLA